VAWLEPALLSTKRRRVHVENWLKRGTRSLWGPVLRRVDARAEQIARASVGAEVAALREDIWHSKVLNLGDRLLVGARPLGLVFLLDPEDRVITPRFVLDGEYEQHTTAFLLKSVTPENVCIDVGANFGYFTCLMARLAWQGKTIAFEADPQVFGQLRENVFVNWCEPIVETVNAAVGDVEGTVTLHRRVGRSANTSMIAPAFDEADPTGVAVAEEFLAECMTLDSLVDRLERVDFVKIDVEGAETLVVNGMHELVRRHRPTVIMEWSVAQADHGGFDLRRLAKQLRSLELEPSIIGPAGDVLPISFDDLATLRYQNIVFKPRA
jgi:FkbM family methyltransferase